MVIHADFAQLNDDLHIFDTVQLHQSDLVHLSFPILISVLYGRIMV